jgi:RNA polymerase sigma-70 factor, ECF subfamily
VYFRLSEQHSQAWNNRSHFFAAVSEVMRRILVNHALARKTDKRGGDWLATTLGAVDRAGIATDTPGFDVLDLDRALESLARLDERQAKLVELRYFAGLTLEETAEAMSLSPATVKREWGTARLWLKRELERRA